MSVLGISLKESKEEQELYRLICDNQTPIIIGIGDAGTGKTMCSVATALQLVLDKKYNQIIYTRNPVEVGKSLGFLKGGLESKFGPYTAPLYDTLEAICHHSTNKLNKNDLAAKIEVEPLGFLRGRSFAPGTILIVDEAQNLNLASLKTVMTRMSDYCKVILLGSMNQIDDYEQRRKDKCDFQKVIDKFRDSQCPYAGIVELKTSMRSKWCAYVDALLSEIDKPFAFEPEYEVSKEEKGIQVTWGDGEHEDTFTI